MVASHSYDAMAAQAPAPAQASGRLPSTSTTQHAWTHQPEAEEQQQQQQQRRSGLQGVLMEQPKFVRELLAGGIAGGLSKTSVAPLERTKILLQTGRTQHLGIMQTLAYMWRTEGVAGYFKGNGASVLRVVPYAAIHFSAYEWYRLLLVEHVLPLCNSRGNIGNTPATAATAARHSSDAALAAAGAEAAAGAAAGVGLEAATFETAALGVAVGEAGAEGESSGDRAGSHMAASTSGRAGAELLGGNAGSGGGGSSSSGGSSSGSGSGGSSGRSVGSGKKPMLGSNPVWDLLAGSAAGATAVVLTYPLDLVRTQLAYNTEAPSSSLRPPPASTLSASIAPASSMSSSRGNSAPAQPQHAAAAPSNSSSNSACNTRRNRRVGILQQLGRTFQEGGVAGLYRGMAPTLVGILPYAGLKFYCYQSLKEAYIASAYPSRSPSSPSALDVQGIGQAAESRPGAGAGTNTGAGADAGAGAGAGADAGAGPGNKPPVAISLLFGGVSGLIAQTVTYPLDLVRRRMQVLTLAGATPATPAAVAAVAPPAVAAVAAPHAASPGLAWAPACNLPAGAAAAACYHRASTPAATVATAATTTARLPGVAAASPAPTALSSLGILASILRTEGPRGLFRGVCINWIKAVPSTAIGFTVYDQLKAFLGLHNSL